MPETPQPTSDTSTSYGTLFPLLGFDIEPDDEHEDDAPQDV